MVPLAVQVGSMATIATGAEGPAGGTFTVILAAALLHPLEFFAVRLKVPGVILVRIPLVLL